MTTWLLIDSIGICVLALIVYLLLRQVGFLLQRAGPVGARSTTVGPRIGESIVPHFPRLALESRKAKLLVFMSEECGVCKAVRAGAEEVARSWKSDTEIFMFYDCAADEQELELTSLTMGLYIKKEANLRLRLGATFVPFAVVTDSRGIVVSKALVNGVSHLESMLEYERSVRSRTAVAGEFSEALTSLDVELE